MNENRYQAVNSSWQINTTDKRLNDIYSVDKPLDNFEKDNDNAYKTYLNFAKVQKMDGRNQSVVKRKKRVILFLHCFLCFFLFILKKNNHLTLI